MDFGYSSKRIVALHLAITTPIVCLSIDCLLNKIIISYRMLALSLAVLFLYLLCAFIGSAVQSRPVYANDLGFLEHHNVRWAEVCSKSF